MSAQYLLVDGHSVIYAWPHLRALHDARPAAAREEFVRLLQRLHDAGPWLVTVVFDGKFGSPPFRTPNQIVVAYSTADETADAVIERTVSGSGKARQIVVVTADEAERHTVEALDATVLSPDWLLAELEMQERDLQSRLRQLSRKNRW